MAAAPQQTDRQRCREIFELWKRQDQSLEGEMTEMLEWMRRVNDLGLPKYEETGDRLQLFMEHLESHFRAEDELADELAANYDADCPEVAAVKRQSISDHQHLIARLKVLIEKLKSAEPPYASWTEASDEIGLFLCAVEQHEDYESDSLGALMP